MLVRLHNWLQNRSHLTRSVIAAGFTAGLAVTALVLVVNRRNLAEWDLTQPQATFLAAIVGGPFILLTALAAIHNQRTTMNHERQKFTEELAEQRRQADEKVREARLAESRSRVIPLYTKVLDVYSEVNREFGTAAEEAKMHDGVYTFEQARAIYTRVDEARKKLAYNTETQHGILLLVDDYATGRAVSNFQDKVSFAAARGSSFKMSGKGPGDELTVDCQLFYDACQQIRYVHKDVVGAIRAHLVTLAGLKFDRLEPHQSSSASDSGV